MEEQKHEKWERSGSQEKSKSERSEIEEELEKVQKVDNKEAIKRL